MPGKTKIFCRKCCRFVSCQNLKQQEDWFWSLNHCCLQPPSLGQGKSQHREMKLWKAKCSPQLLLCFRKVSEPSVCSSDDTTWRCIQSLQLLQLRNFRSQRRSDSSDSYDKEKALKTSQDRTFTHSALIHTEDCWRSLNLAEDYWTLDVIEVVDAHWSYVEAAGQKVEVKEGQEERRPVLKAHMFSVGRSEYPSTQNTQVQFL